MKQNKAFRFLVYLAVVILIAVFVANKMESNRYVRSLEQRNAAQAATILKQNEQLSTLSARVSEAEQQVQSFANRLTETQRRASELEQMIGPTAPADPYSPADDTDTDDGEPGTGIDWDAVQSEAREKGAQAAEDINDWLAGLLGT